MNPQVTEISVHYIGSANNLTKYFRTPPRNTHYLNKSPIKWNKKWLENNNINHFNFLLLFLILGLALKKKYHSLNDERQIQEKNYHFSIILGSVFCVHKKLFSTWTAALAYNEYAEFPGMDIVPTDLLQVQDLLWMIFV